MNELTQLELLPATSPNLNFYPLTLSNLIASLLVAKVSVF